MPELRFVDRDKITGKINGHYACMQREGQESLWDDCAEMQEFAQKQKDLMTQQLENTLEFRLKAIEDKVKDVDLQLLQSKIAALEAAKEL